MNWAARRRVRTAWTRRLRPWPEPPPWNRSAIGWSTSVPICRTFTASTPRPSAARPLQDAFTSGSIHAVLGRHAATPDGALLSQETLHDY
jgi:hypothetical protein